MNNNFATTKTTTSESSDDASIIMHKLQRLCPTLITLLRIDDILPAIGNDNGNDVVSNNNNDYWKHVQFMFVLRILIVRASHILGNCILSGNSATLTTTTGDDMATMENNDNAETNKFSTGSNNNSNNQLSNDILSLDELEEKLELFQTLLKLVENRIGQEGSDISRANNNNNKSATTTATPLSILFVQVSQAYKLHREEQLLLQWMILAKMLPSTSILYALLPHAIVDNITTVLAPMPQTVDPYHADIIQFICGISTIEWNRLSAQKESTCPWKRDGIMEFQANILDDGEKHVHVPNEVCTLLMGGYDCPLRDDERIKLSDTLLLQIFEQPQDATTIIPQGSNDAASNDTPENTFHEETEVALFQDETIVSEMLKKVRLEEEEEEDKQEEWQDLELLKELEDMGMTDQDAEELDDEKGLPSATTTTADYVHSDEPHCYTCELDYLNDQFALVMHQIQLSNQRLEQELKDMSGVVQMASKHTSLHNEGGSKKFISTGEINAKIKLIQTKIDKSLQLTREKNASSSQKNFYPRLEGLVQQLELDSFEKSVLIYLCGSMISPIFKMAVKEDSYSNARKRTIGDILVVFCSSVSEQVAARTYFYQSSKLIRKGLVHIASSKFSFGTGESDLTDQELHLDRRVLDCIVGLDKESTEVTRGTHLYDPKVKLDMVVLPSLMKESITNAVKNFDMFRTYRKHSKFDAVISYGVGLTLMFCGPSGTGKTLTANAIAAELKKKLLLVNFPTLVDNSNEAGLRIQSIFREAELSNAIIFFDECEAIFAKRQGGGGGGVVTELLTELERYEGIVLLATNRPYDLDEAMYRRISDVFEFKQPNHLERLEIWKLVTAHEAIPYKEDSIDWESIALKYELTGGFIKNAVISALTAAVGRDSKSPLITEQDIIEGCKKQMRGALQMQDFDERVVPSSGMDDLILPDNIKDELQKMINLDKARGVLFGSWGFSDDMRSRQGTTALFWGPKGCGKNLAAQAIGFELGKAIKRVDFPQLLYKTRERSAAAVLDVFKEARLMDAVLVLDGYSLENMESSGSITTDKATHDEIRLLNLVIQEMTRFPGVVIMMLETATVGFSPQLDLFLSRLDKGLMNGLKFIVQFDVPNLSDRASLWEKMVPSTLPTKRLDFMSLAKDSNQFTQVQIGNVIYKASAAAAMRTGRQKQVVTMSDLKMAIEEEKKRSESAANNRYRNQYI